MQTEDCPLDLHMKEKYRAYRKFLRDFPQTCEPEIDENGEAVDNYEPPQTLDELLWKRKCEGFPPCPIGKPLRCVDPLSRV
jgi:hypothetical protein